ncbi:hypothetical protein BDW02DRAFT_113525 [Decorospora gaudefroyi]|uniref:Uncharacterized protein n=1 Tax=Decorospora gaudefroyi TaxID=184978 RepID=A0A6A5JYY3_9PLEO|nr:hypothetical protein BDW02DRAFT_113525 [Decorospora gaudefroyi]
MDLLKSQYWIRIQGTRYLAGLLKRAADRLSETCELLIRGRDLTYLEEPRDITGPRRNLENVSRCLEEGRRGLLVSTTIDLDAVSSEQVQDRTQPDKGNSEKQRPNPRSPNPPPQINKRNSEKQKPNPQPQTLHLHRHRHLHPHSPTLYPAH